MSFLKRLVQPLRSRKTRVALATVLAAFAVEYSLDVSEKMIYTIICVAVAVILGIAVEDAGAKRAGKGGKPGGKL